AAKPGDAPARQSWMSITGDNVVIDTVKKAEDDDGIIVRLYEAHGARGRRIFKTALPVKQILETDLMEREEQTLEMRNGEVRLDFTPFQIRTFKLVL
ncbi:MAG: glycosyl hydrolase-related protein, partial [bacterium]